MRSGFLALATALLAPALASAAVIEGYTPGNLRTDGGMVAGNTFVAVSNQVIASLGFIDVGNDGISGSYLVGLWNSSQVLLASTLVTPDSPLINGFRYSNIAPQIIPQTQSFTIGVLLPESPADAWVDGSFLALGSGFAGAGQGRYIPSTELDFPSTLGNTNSYVIVNASSSPVAVPEPGSIVLVSTCTIAFAARWRRRGSTLS